MSIEPKRRILILNWRDITHPRAGGAERVTYEIASRWVEWGHQVTWFSASYPGAAPEERLDGVRMLRQGSQKSVHWRAYQYYRSRLRGHVDLILDEVNTIPFFAPLYAREPVLMYSNQLAREVWHYEAPFPLSAVGYAAEPLYLRAYRRTPVMTISRSTEQDLRAIGLAGPYYVIPMSIDTAAPPTLPSLDTKESDLTLIFVGRVVPSKRVDHIIDGLAEIHRAGVPSARLWIVGACDERYRRHLDHRIAALGIRDAVAFFGRVETAMKERLLARAHIFVMASVREGWGLVVTEANALGTPAVVYDAPGLRDSTRHGETGLVCKTNTPYALAQAAVALWRDQALYAEMRYRAWADAKALSWQQTACAAWNAVEASL